MELTLNDIFAGCGGLGLGFKQAGFTIVGSWDWDKYAVQSYKANVEDHVKQADVREMHWNDLPQASVWSFGFPCVDLSIAGQQKGMIMGCDECGYQFPLRDLQDGTCPKCTSSLIRSLSRSGLFFDVMRLLHETCINAREHLPAIIMAENVKGLQPFLGTLEEEYRRAGYTMQHVLFNSKYWGVPQSRERYYVVGIRADLIDKINFSFPVQQTEYIPRLSSILEPVVAEKYYMGDEKAAAIIQQALLRIPELHNVHATVTPARIEKRQNGRRAKPDEEEMFTLTAQDIHGIIQSVYTDKDGCSYCCDANYFKGTSPNDVGNGRRTQVIEEVAIFSGGYVNMSEVAATSEQPQIEMIGMLDIKAKDQCRRVYDPKGLAPTLTAVQGGYQEAKIFDSRRYRVRKLTPREYARLQGFPEDYRFVCSDSQNYKQLGNAVSVPVAYAIADKIRQALEEI